MPPSVYVVYVRWMPFFNANNFRELFYFCCESTHQKKMRTNKYYHNQSNDHEKWECFNKKTTKNSRCEFWFKCVEMPRSAEQQQQQIFVWQLHSSCSQHDQNRAVHKFWCNSHLLFAHFIAVFGMSVASFVGTKRNGDFQHFIVESKKLQLPKRIQAKKRKY